MVQKTSGGLAVERRQKSWDEICRRGRESPGENERDELTELGNE